MARKYGRLNKIDKPDNGPKLDVPSFSGPSLYLSISQLPAAKEWEVGKKYHLEIEAELTHMSKNSVTLEVKKVGTEKDEEEDDADEKDDTDGDEDEED